MTRLTKAQRHELEVVYADLQRGISYIMSPQVAVCRVSRGATDTLTFSRQPLSPEAAEILLTPEQKARGNYTLVEVTKDIGSNLTGIFAARQTLARILGIA